MSLHRLLPFAALAAALSIFVAACGGGSASGATAPAGASNADPASSASPGNGPAPTDDAAYLKAVCTDVNDAINPILNKIANDPSLLSDQQKLIAESTPVLSDLSTKLSAIEAPADLKPYHDELVGRFNDVVAQAKSGQLKGIGDIGNATRGANVPQDVKDRVRNTGNQIPECQQSLAFGSDFFG